MTLLSGYPIRRTKGIVGLISADFNSNLNGDATLSDQGLPSKASIKMFIKEVLLFLFTYLLHINTEIVNIMISKEGSKWK